MAHRGRIVRFFRPNATKAGSCNSKRTPSITLKPLGFHRHRLKNLTILRENRNQFLPPFTVQLFFLIITVCQKVKFYYRYRLSKSL
jgi:hypothetical protein